MFRTKVTPLLFTTASERYRVLLERTPDLLQRIPFERLASYLGITPVSLSRIRAKLKQIERFHVSWRKTLAYVEKFIRFSFVRVIVCTTV